MRMVLLIHCHHCERNFRECGFSLFDSSVIHCDTAFYVICSLASCPVYCPRLPMERKTKIVCIFAQIVCAVAVFPLILYGLAVKVIPDLFPRFALVFFRQRELAFVYHFLDFLSLLVAVFAGESFEILGHIDSKAIFRRRFDGSRTPQRLYLHVQRQVFDVSCRNGCPVSLVVFMSDLAAEERDVVSVSAETETDNFSRSIYIVSIQHDIEIYREGDILLLAGCQQYKHGGKCRNINVLSHISFNYSHWTTIVDSASFLYLRPIQWMVSEGNCFFRSSCL